MKIQATNAEYISWEQQDQLLVSWLLSSMTESMPTRMIGCETASQIRTKLNYAFPLKPEPKSHNSRVCYKSSKKDHYPLMSIYKDQEHSQLSCFCWAYSLPFKSY